MAMRDLPEPTHQGARGRWLQIGLLAATAFAPLIARWQSLREDDRAAALRYRASALRERAAVRAAQAAQAARSLTRAFRRRPVDASAPDLADLVDLAESASDAGELTSGASVAAQVAEMASGLAPLAALIPAAPLTDLAADAVNGGRRGRALRVSFWVAGVSVGLIAAGVSAYIIVRNRQMAREERDTYHALALDALDAEELDTPSVHAPVPVAPEPPAPPAVREPDFATPPEFSDADAAGAGWAGDIYTKVYGPASEAGANGASSASASHVVFFATEEDARAAGYHRAGGPPAGRD